jgi:hypothetical protein
LSEPSIDEQLGSGDIAAVIGDEEYDRSRYLIWRAESTERNRVGDHGSALLADRR